MQNLENAFVFVGLEHGKMCLISPASFKSAALLLLVCFNVVCHMSVP